MKKSKKTGYHPEVIAYLARIGAKGRRVNSHAQQAAARANGAKHKSKKSHELTSSRGSGIHNYIITK